MCRALVRALLPAFLLIVSLLILPISGCVETNSSEEEKPFADYFDFSKEAARLKAEDPTVRKTIIKDGSSQTTNSKINWEVELAPFIDADINIPINKDRYSIQETMTGALREVVYLSKDSSLPVKNARFVYQFDELKEAHIYKQEETKLYTTVQELSYEPESGYTISVQQKVDFAFETDFIVEGLFLQEYPSGGWLIELDLGEEILPFDMKVHRRNGVWEGQIANADERIKVDAIEITEDSFKMRLPVFDSEFLGSINNQTRTISGLWSNYSKGPEYKIPFKAQHGDIDRFRNAGMASSHPNVEGQWEVTFSPNTEDSYPAIGVFRQSGGALTGTFLTETGDYRYLEGNTFNDVMYLSAFDGAHSFLFYANVVSKDSLQGLFWSGNHWREPWVAIRNNNAQLNNPDSLTYLKEGYTQFDFRFPDLRGEEVSLSDDRFNDKAVIVEIMGSWCPNCKDETTFLADTYRKYKDEGLEVVALAYERSDDFNEAREAIIRHKNHLGADYTFLVAGVADKRRAAETLPMLNHVMSFPTTIFIDKNGNVRRIYTGFYGPGTGEHYTRFVNSSTALIETMLAE